ncbi:hypothetical protein HAX54_021178 [Datura stramonium]|uniref:HIG1 domain-containing protein n=1 Tax=Datura stramonium TaxID=4076 RepID=A0ABS8UV71_DATST|nr:hypothetical protein [Datura stramonium]
MKTLNVPEHAGTLLKPWATEIQLQDLFKVQDLDCKTHPSRLQIALGMYVNDGDSALLSGPIAVINSAILYNFTGAFLTAGVLTAGLISFKRGNSQLGQQLMRARVLVQGGTVALMVGSAYYYGDNFKRAG